jgi:hypothetical protein
VNKKKQKIFIHGADDNPTRPYRHCERSEAIQPFLSTALVAVN